ncbi:MAG: response regulator [Coleofasciculaceae cyanobacterium]
MELKTKFISGFLGVASLVAVLGFINIQTGKNVNKQFNTITERTAPELIALDQIKSASLRMMAETYSYAVIQSEATNSDQVTKVEKELEDEQEEKEDDFKEATEDLEAGLEKLEILAEGQSRKDIYNQLIQGKSKLEKIGQEILALKTQGIQGDEIIIKRQEFEKVEEEFLKVIDKALNSNLEALEIKNANANRSATYSQAINLAAVVAVIIISITLGLILAEKITKPIITIKDAAVAIGGGKFNTKVQIKTNDELAVLANAFNHMVSKLQETTVSKSYLDNIIRALSDSLIVLNKDLRIQSFNEATVLLSGYQTNELFNQSLNILFNQGIVTDISDLLTNKNQSNRSFLTRQESRFLTKEGRTLAVSVAASIMENAAGETEGIVCLIQDISARKRAEAVLRRQALMFETIYDGVIITNLAGHITDWNPAAERIFGYKKAEVIGKNASIIYQQKGKNILTKRMLDTVIGDGRWSGELEFIHQDGSQGICETVIAPLRSESGEIVATIGVNRDITERKHYENQLVEAREAALEAARAKSQFLANMSHEIRTPMNGVLGMSELLLTTNLTSQQLDFVQTLQVSGEHLLTVINDVLDFSKLEAGEMRLDSNELELNHCLEDVLDLCGAQAGDKDVELCLLVEKDVPRQLIGDAGRLRQILTNLVGNAIKFTDKGEVLIRVSLSKQTDNEQEVKLRFFVQDTGIGIATEDQKKLFQSFSQVDNSTTRQFTGTGLGLAICKQLVQIMGGEIGVESQLGVGSTFWFTAKFGKLATQPEDEPTARIAPGVPVSPEVLRGKKVLVVDDRAVNRQIVQHQLMARGIEVDEAENGVAALHILQAAAEAGKPYDVALLDMKMPKIDGSTLGRLILTEPQWAQTKLVLMTSMHAADTGEPLLRSGFSDYLVKPVKESRLLQSLVKVLVPQERSPVVQEQWVRKEKSTSGSQPRKNLKILLVEDTPVNLKLARRQVGLLGYQADSAGNGQKALDKLAEQDYDIVLMDCQMPVMDGYKATEILRQRETHHTVVIGMTAYAMTEDRQKCLDAGMDDYLSKPVMVKDLGPMLQKWSSKIEGDVGEENDREFSSQTAQILASLPEFSSDLVDWYRLQEISQGDASFQLELVREFVRDGETILAEAKQALTVQDWNTLANKAHQIKGASASVAVQSMSDLANQLHEQLKTNNFEAAPNLVTQLEQILDKLKAF